MDMSPNPGFQLRALLVRRFPHVRKSTSYLSQMDEAFGADGELLDIAYESAINYMLRRLITGAAHVERACRENELYEEEYNTRLRAFLRDTLLIETRAVERIHALLKDCVRVARMGPSDFVRKCVRREAEQAGGPRCYICGCAVTFATSGEIDSAEIEHVWPKDMGGVSEPCNLRVACHRCNQDKKSCIDASDFHYEEICLVSDRGDENFTTEFRREYRAAVRAMQRYRCSLCNRSAETSGLNEFRKRNDGDSWHFLNISAICENHGDDND